MSYRVSNITPKLKILTKVIIFLLIFVIGISYITDLFLKHDSMGYQNIKSFYQEHENTLDAVYIGSSNCFVFWNSLAAWEEYGITVFPYACNANLFYSTEYIIKEARKTQPDALYIVNINSLSEGSVSVPQIRNLIDCMPFSMNKLELIKHLSDIGDYSLKDRMEFYLPILRYHSRWSELAGDTSAPALNGYKGASTYPPYLARTTDISEKYILTDKEAELSKDLISSTESLLAYCEKEKVKVLFVTVPQVKPKEKQLAQYNALNSFLEERGYDVLDLSKRLDEMDISLSTDFYNEAHTNIHGSLKFTYYLSEYLTDNYDFDDKREFPAYAAWNTAYERYSKVLSAYTLDFEWDKGTMTDKLDAPELSWEPGEKDGLLSWTEVDGAQGYLIYKKEGETLPWQTIAETDVLSYSAELPKEGESHFYTVVPYYEENGVRYYGDFSYGGVQTWL